MKYTLDHTMLVIASYPPKGTLQHKSVVGGASYTKATLLALTKAFRRHKKKPSFTVLAEQLSDGIQEYKEDAATVKRIWKRAGLFTYPVLLKQIILSQKSTRQIFIGFELSMFGEKLSLLLFPLFLLILRIFGKQVVLVYHQVIFDISEMHGHINIAPTGMKTTLLTYFLRAFYSVTALLSKDVVVFEEVLKERLQKVGVKKHIHVIPLAVEQTKRVSKEASREKLGIKNNEFILLSFGYLAWYKGTDWIARALSNVSKGKNTNLRLILAGGPNPNHTKKPFYKQYLADLMRVCEKNNIRLTGFVSEYDMALYFAASDLVLFPYRTFMSSSAPMATACAYGKPLLLSESMSVITKTSDVANALQLSGLKTQGITFPLDEKTFIKKVQLYQKDRTLRAKNEQFAKLLRDSRSWDKVSEQYYEVLKYA